MQTSISATRGEVLQQMEGFLKANMSTFLKSVEESWQPADFLPDSRHDTFFDEVKELREKAGSLSYDLLAVLIGDTITEEALPNYEAWFFPGGLTAWSTAPNPDFTVFRADFCSFGLLNAIILYPAPYGSGRPLLRETRFLFITSSRPFALSLCNPPYQQPAAKFCNKWKAF